MYFKHPPGGTMSNNEVSRHIFDRIASRHVEVDTYTANNVNESQNYPSSHDEHFLFFQESILEYFNNIFFGTK